MNLFPSSVPVTVEVTYDSPGLFVGLSVFDMSTGSPVQVGGVLPMANVAGTNSYVRNFTPAADKPYFFLKQVYTDNTYTAVNPSYSAGSEGGYASSFLATLALILSRVGAQNANETNLLGFLFADEMRFGALGEAIPVDIVQGAGAVLNCKFLYRGSLDPLDLTGVSEIETCFLNDDGTELMLSLTGTEIAVFGNPILGKITITLTGVQSAALAVARLATLQVKFTFPGGQPVVLQIPAAYNVLATAC